MTGSKVASTVEVYLTSLPADRRAELSEVRAVVNAHLPRGYEEVMQYGMICWVVPATRLAETYNGQPLMLASLAAQRRHLALYLMCAHGDPALLAWFRDAAKAAGKQLDMGKACVRFQRAQQLPLDAIGELIARVSVEAYVASYHATRATSVKPKPVRAKATRAAVTSAAAPGAATSTRNKATAKQGVGKRAAPGRPAAPGKQAAPGKRAAK